MTEQGMRFRIGLFVLAALVLLASLVTLFGSMPVLFKAQHEYTVTFKDAPGIGAGTPVRRSGVRIGEVKTIDCLKGRVEADVRYIGEWSMLMDVIVLFSTALLIWRDERAY